MQDGDGGLPIVGLRLAEGRTGSTLVMQLLGTAPEFVFDRKYPAEYRWVSPDPPCDVVGVVDEGA